MSVIISTDLILTPGPATEPLGHARIGYKKITGTIAASTFEAGFPASDADNEMTYNHWKPTAMPATWEIDAGSSVDANYIGIAAHTCGTDQTTVIAEYWDGAAWQTISSTLPALNDDSPIMFIFNTLTRTKYRVRLTGSTTPRIGVIYMGVTLDMMRGIYGGHSPITLSRMTETRPVKSEGGQFLGRSIIRKGSFGSWSWNHLTPGWYRLNFDPFVEHARIKPFFIAWRPGSYPNEIGYCWTNDDIKPSNMGLVDLMEVSFSAEGLAVD
jgi:hypothetical protein